MDYEKKYKEAIELMKDCIPDADGLVHVRPQDIFPELEESEDEKVRKEIISYIKNSTCQVGNAVYNSWIAWLEKQGEQKPTIEMKTPEESLGIDSETYNKIVDECVYGEQKPATWSEEDELRMENILSVIEGHGYPMEVKWLKSIKGRHTWKPSDEQLFDLKGIAKQNEHNMLGKSLMSLYNDLLKLKG